MGCCGSPDKASGFQVVPMPDNGLFKDTTNPCSGKKPTLTAFDNKACFQNGVVDALEQAGADVSVGYKGNLSTDAVPITSSYFAAGLCPVNVHWHLGAEHRSEGEYDETGTGPGRRLADSDVRLGFRCKKYNASDSKFTTEYDWKHCVGMKVGETYEVHWPHSAAGMCGTPWQYQSPFYDGVFCVDAAVALVLAGTIKTNDAVGVHGQVFTIVNDENYYYPDMIRGMIIEGDMGKDVTKYTGSTTGTSRNNEMCSSYAPITWQVDRKCHLISASSFDKMCADMKAQPADMSSDLHAHGARELVADALAADNHQNRL